MPIIGTTFIPEMSEKMLMVKDSIADITLQQVLTRAKEFDVVATMNLNGDYISDAVENLGWEVGEQAFAYQGLQGRNIIGRSNIGEGPVVIIGAHYDTRKTADQTPGSTEPVPGAVDGASGVAVLIELARTLELDDVDREIWLTFFDVEDQGSGGMPEFSYIVGSTFMADNLDIAPEAMVLVDMIGDADQQLFYEGNSDHSLRGLL